MSRTLEFESKNVEKALEKASNELSIPKDRLKHDVISFGSTGIFGLVGAKKAKIRVVLDDAATPAPANEPAEGPEGVQKSAQALVNEAFDEGPSSEDPNMEDVEKVGRETLSVILGAIVDDADIRVRQDQERVIFEISSQNSGVLIGKRGQTLEALQYLLDKIINRETTRRIRVQVDVEGYLANKKLNLKKMAEKLAEKVKRNGKPVSLGQLNAHDRRIVHLSLKDDQEVRTQSVGEGFYRKLMIFPKKRAPRKKNA